MHQPAAGRNGSDPCTAPDWQGLPSWRILDTAFGVGLGFFQTWQCWRADAKAPHMLHYVAFCHQGATVADLASTCAGNLPLQPLVAQLSEQWFGLLPGFHRFLLDQGRVVLTLCVGDTLALLRQQKFEADAITAHVNLAADGSAPESWSVWSAKALARCCRRGTTLRINAAAPLELTALRDLFGQCGFLPASQSANPVAPDSCAFQARFDPSWVLKKTRQDAQSPALPIARCAVVGAGLAGASVAASLARRGWQVQVLDQAAEPAAGASGLPVGLLVPHVSSDDCTLSRLSRAGVRLMRQQAGELLQLGVDWAPSGVLERQLDGVPQLPASWSDSGQQWSSPYQADALDNSTIDLGPGIWHHKGAWIKPAKLVQSWLNQPGVSFMGNAQVDRLRQQNGVWDLLDCHGRVLCSAERVVLANASGAKALLQTVQRDHPALAKPLKNLPTMQGVRGLLSWARYADGNTNNKVFPPFPVNGSGSIIPNMALADGTGWFMGSSYQPEWQVAHSDQDNHLRNFARLQKLLPALARTQESAFFSGTLPSWKGTRCVTADRLPLAGPIDQQEEQPSLWLCAGMGSRGLSFSMLCAELLAARWGAEPLPIEANLAKSLDALRA